MAQTFQLRVWRNLQEPKLTQTRLASTAGLSASRYWQIENGEGAAPSDDEKAAVAAALGIRVRDIAWPVHEAKAS